MLFYLFATGTCCITAAGFYYLYDKNKAETLLYGISWNMIKAYATLEDYYEKSIKPKVDKFFGKKTVKVFGKKTKKNEEFIKKDENEKIIEKITLYNKKTDKYETCIEIPEDVGWGFVKKKIGNNNKCKIYENISDRDVDNEEFVLIDKPFLQVELEQNEKKKEIHEFLHYFYLKENKILDTEFLKWYMEYWYKIKLADNYKIHIIDHMVNIVTIEKGNYIILGGGGNYDIKK